MPRFSVVIPAFNAERTIGETIGSVLAQTESDLELIVVDDGSSDATPELVAPARGSATRACGSCARRTPGRPALVTLESQHATAAYVSFLDNDDLWMPRYLERMGAALDAEPGAGFAYCDAYALDDAVAADPPPDRVRVSAAAGGWIVSGGVLAALSRANFVMSSATVRREALDEAGGFRTDVLGVDDYDLWFRILLAGWTAVAGEPGPLLLQRDRADSQSKDNPMMLEGLARVLEGALTDSRLPAAARAAATEQLAAAKRERAAADGRGTRRASAPRRAQPHRPPARPAASRAQVSRARRLPRSSPPSRSSGGHATAASGAPAPPRRGRRRRVRSSASDRLAATHSAASRRSAASALADSDVAEIVASASASGADGASRRAAGRDPSTRCPGTSVATTASPQESASRTANGGFPPSPWLVESSTSASGVEPAHVGVGIGGEQGVVEAELGRSLRGTRRPRRPTRRPPRPRRRAPPPSVAANRGPPFASQCQPMCSSTGRSPSMPSAARAARRSSAAIGVNRSTSIPPGITTSLARGAPLRLTAALIASLTQGIAATRRPSQRYLKTDRASIAGCRGWRLCTCQITVGSHAAATAARTAGTSKAVKCVWIKAGPGSSASRAPTQSRSSSRSSLGANRTSMPSAASSVSHSRSRAIGVKPHSASNPRARASATIARSIGMNEPP